MPAYRPCRVRTAERDDREAQQETEWLAAASEKSGRADQVTYRIDDAERS